jgi:hypothetical protein
LTSYLGRLAEQERGLARYEELLTETCTAVSGAYDSLKEVVPLAGIAYLMRVSRFSACMSLGIDPNGEHVSQGLGTT